MSQLVENEETKAIRQSIMDYYFQGFVKSDPVLFRQIFHENWKFNIVDKEHKLVTFDRDTYLARFDPSKADPNMNWEIEFYSIDVNAATSSVKIRLENQKSRFIDFFNMIKIEGKWWIIHKLATATFKQ